MLDHLRSGALTAGHARALLSSGVPAEELAGRIIGEGLSVRDAERLAKDAARNGSARKKCKAIPASRDADIIALEKSLTDTLGLRVSVSHKGNTGGELRIMYKTLEQLDEVCRRLSNTN